MPIPAREDRALRSFAGDQVDGTGRARDERDGGGLAALAGDPQDAVATLDGEVLDVGPAGLAYPEPVQTE